MAQLVALITTLTVEGLGMAVAAHLLPGWRRHWRRALLLALGLNLVSHTIYWNSLLHISPFVPATILFAELIVAILEGAVYAATVARPFWTAWLVSVVLNWASWIAGGYVWRYFS